MTSLTFSTVHCSTSHTKTSISIFSTFCSVHICYCIQPAVCCNIHNKYITHSEIPSTILNMLYSTFIHLINVIYFWIQVSSDAKYTTYFSHTIQEIPVTISQILSPNLFLSDPHSEYTNINITTTIYTIFPCYIL